MNTPRRGCASRRRPAPVGAVRARTGGPRAGRTRPLLPRPGRDVRPTARGGRRRRRRLPRGRHPHHRHHRRQRPDGGCDRPSRRHRGREPHDHHRRPARPPQRTRARPAAARTRRADLRAQLTRGQAADRRRPARRRERRRDDRRRRQRRPRAPPRRHRRGHGPVWHRRRPRGLDDGSSPTTTSPRS